jgi:hypothetical protein
MMKIGHLYTIVHNGEKIMAGRLNEFVNIYIQPNKDRKSNSDPSAFIFMTPYVPPAPKPAPAPPAAQKAQKTPLTPDDLPEDLKTLEFT